MTSFHNLFKMAFYYFKNLSLDLNGNKLIPSEIQLESEIEVLHPLIIDERTSKKNIPSSPYKSDLKIKYYLTGKDYLKPYLYALENETLTGNFCGLIFTQGYISDYSVTFNPNSPIEISATIDIFDKISGNFTLSNPINQTGTILRTSDVIVDNLSNYTSAILSNIVQASYNYSCRLNPSYSYDSGVPLTNADRVSIEDRTWNVEVISDSTNLDISLSGQRFALTVSGVNPYNNQIKESFSSSGVIYYKQLNISNNKVHSHVLRLSQSHSNNIGGISGVSITPFTFEITSTPNSHPFTNSSLSCIDKIMVADTICPTYIVSNGLGSNDKITVMVPNDVINGPLSIFTSKGNLFWPSPLIFSYNNIIISGISQNTGYPGTPIYITGSNFYRIGRVSYGGVNSSFQVISPNVILSVVPPNALTNNLQVISNLRQLTGTTNSYFYCKPSINLLTPVTGAWKDPLVIEGINFSGTTGVKFGTGMINALSFSVTNNNILSVQSPDTGVGYAEGYITVLTSGGSTQTISKYSPEVPLYSFNPLSGKFLDALSLSTKIDSGYLSPTGGGYKIRLGTIDTIFYQNGTGALTGQIPLGGNTDYIYIYKPDGVSTYTPNSLQFIVHANPSIFSITPAIVNQYQYINPVLVGNNFEFFQSQLPYYFAISGGLNGDMQSTYNIISNSGGNGDTLYVPNFLVTGQTGYYDILVQNLAGTGIFKSGLLVNTGINQTSNCTAKILPPLNQLAKFLPSYAIDNSTGTFAGLVCTTIASGTVLQILPKNNGLLKVNLVKILPWTQNFANIAFNTSGYLSLWYKNAIAPFYSTQVVDFSLPQNQVINLFNSGITGVAIVKVYTPAADASLNRNIFLGVSDLQIY